MAGEVPVRVDYSGLCASDIHEYSDDPLIIASTPQSMIGHSIPFSG